MESRNITFDQVFKIWLEAELDSIEGRDILPVAKQKGFNSISEWRLNTSLRMGLDSLNWNLETLAEPLVNLPKIIVGPYQGWSKFFDNDISTTFEQAMEIPEFFDWCKTHDRVVPLSKNFPLPTTIIVLRKPNGQLVHIEGGHRICAVTFANKIGQPISIQPNDISIAVANIEDSKITELQEFLKQGTFKK